MAHILLGCIVGKVPSRVIACYRALLDFIYIAQYTTHDNSSLQGRSDEVGCTGAPQHTQISFYGSLHAGDQRIWYN
jgi:hypothetical protein